MREALRRLAQDVCIGGSICGLGDFGAQKCLSARSESLDKKRMSAIVAYGGLAAVPYHYWYRWLAFKFPAAVATKTALECLLVLPLFEIPALMVFTGIFGRDQTPQEAFAQLARDYWTACAYGIVVWAPASLATFRFVAPKYHLATFYAVGAFWDFGISYLSFDRSASSDDNYKSQQRHKR